jgi:hypothetical protein
LSNALKILAAIVLILSFPNVFAQNVPFVQTGILSGEGLVFPNYPYPYPLTVGSTVSVTAVPNDGWTFLGWVIDGAWCLGGPFSNPCTFAMPNEPVHVYAKFDLPFSFDLSGFPSTFVLARSHGASFPVTVVLSKGLPQVVTLTTYAPEGSQINAQIIGQPSGYPTFATTLSVLIPSSEPLGVRQITIIGTAQNGLTRTATLTLNIDS